MNRLDSSYAYPLTPVPGTASDVLGLTTYERGHFGHGNRYGTMPGNLVSDKRGALTSDYVESLDSVGPNPPPQAGEGTHRGDHV